MSEKETQTKKYWLETYGCQMNKAESGFLEYGLRKRGWQPASGPEEANVVVLNTCSVRQTAEDRIWGRLGFFKAEKRRHPFRLVLMGCMSERLKEEIFNEAPQVDLLVGNYQKHRLAELLDSGDSGGDVDDVDNVDKYPADSTDGRRQMTAHLIDPGEYRFAERHTVAGFRAYLPIMHGCNNFCTYCIVPYVRGREVSRSPESILEEIRALQLSQGEQGSRAVPRNDAVREITLLGQNVNSYRYRESDGRIVSFPELLRQILPALQPQTWLRFITSHPKDMSDELIELIAAEPALCRHIHLPVQHGSDRILQAMGRGYTRDRYLDLVARIRKSIPEVSLTTDILIGFPGEREKDYRLTLDLMKTVQFNDAFTYRYNPREGTRAFDLGDDVPDAVKQQRLSGVIELQRRLTRSRKLLRIGNVAEVLVEGVSKKSSSELLARTERDEMVVFPGTAESIGMFAQVRLVRLEGSTYRGERIG